MFGRNECFLLSCKSKPDLMREVHYKQKLRKRYGALAEKIHECVFIWLFWQRSIWERKCEAKKLLSKSCPATRGHPG